MVARNNVLALIRLPHSRLQPTTFCFRVSALRVGARVVRPSLSTYQQQLLAVDASDIHLIKPEKSFPFDKEALNVPTV